MLDMDAFGFLIVNIGIRDSQVLRDSIYGIGFRHGSIEQNKNDALKFYVVMASSRFKLSFHLEKLSKLYARNMGSGAAPTLGKSIMRRNMLQRPRTYDCYFPYHPRLEYWDLVNAGSQGEFIIARELVDGGGLG